MENYCAINEKRSRDKWETFLGRTWPAVTHFTIKDETTMLQQLAGSFLI